MKRMRAVWWESVPQPDFRSQEFLYGGVSRTGRVTGQSVLKVVSGLEWMCG